MFVVVDFVYVVVFLVVVVAVVAVVVDFVVVDVVVVKIFVVVFFYVNISFSFIVEYIFKNFIKRTPAWTCSSKQLNESSPCHHDTHYS